MNNGRSRGGWIIGLIVVAVLGIGVYLLFNVKRVSTGYEGVVYNLNGGVSGTTLGEGYHLLNPMQRMKEFTTSNEQIVLTRDSREGSEEDESFKVSTSDDASIAISFQMSYRFEVDTLVDTYKKYRGMNGEDIVTKRVAPVVKSRVSEVTTDYSMMDIYSGNRSAINTKLTEYLREKFKDVYGIYVIDASIIDVHPDDKLKESIDARVQALQKKQQAEAERETVKVEAETALIKAQNEADIKVAQAEAEAKANKLKSDSITDKLVKMTEAEARLKHGWVTVQGGGSNIAVVTDEDGSKKK